MQDGASMKFHVGEDRVSQAIVAEGYGITGSAETIPVTIDCTMKKAGSWLLLEADTFNGKSFTMVQRGPGLRLRVATDATTSRQQLWLDKSVGFAIRLR